MTDRQQELVRLLVETYINTAEPVSSSYLAQISDLGVSPATIRNELSMLEEAGYIMSPHTSAGRIPTDKGYRFYIETYVKARGCAEKDRRELAVHREADNRELRLRQMAKKLSELTGETVVLSLSPRRTYTAGVSRLFEKPEFHDIETVQRLTQMIDTMDRTFESLVHEVIEDVQIKIGEETPFGQEISQVMVQYDDGSGQRGVISILGPTRMNYGHNAALLREARRILRGM